MKSAIAKRCALICIATVAAGLAVNQASAAPSDEAAKSVVVHFSDLDLAQPQDARTLYSRIQWAAEVACGDVESLDLGRFARYHNCIRQAVTNAVSTLNVPRVTEIYEAQRLRKTCDVTVQGRVAAPASHVEPMAGRRPPGAGVI